MVLSAKHTPNRRLSDGVFSISLYLTMIYLKKLPQIALLQHSKALLGVTFLIFAIL